LLQGKINGLDATSGIFTINTGGLINNGNGTATINPADAATAASETETGSPSVHEVKFSLSDASGCADSVIINLTVNPLPAVEMVLETSPATDIDGLSVCFDEPSFLIRGIVDGVNATGGSFTTDIGGLINNGDGTATFNPSIAAIAAGETREGESSVHTITFSFSDGNGCQNELQSVITVNPQPTLDIVFESNKTSIDGATVCFDTAPFEIRGRIENGGLFGDIIATDISIDTDGLTFNAATGIATLNPETAAISAGGSATGLATNHLITLQYTDGNGCSNSITHEITISPKPEVSIRNEDGSALTTAFCSDDADQVFQAFADNSPVTSTEVGFVLNSVSITPVNGQIVFSPSDLGAGTYTLQMTFTDGSGPQCGNTITEMITVNAQPVPDIVLEANQTESIEGQGFCFDDADVVFRGVANSVAVTIGTFSASNGGLTDNGDGTATFSPQLAAAGAGQGREGEISTHDIFYTYVDPVTACDSTITRTIVVRPQPTLDIIFLSNGNSIDGTKICYDAGPTTIRGRVEIGGNFLNRQADNISIDTDGLTYDLSTGEAIFDPAAAATSVGEPVTGEETVHNITMTYTDPDGCQNAITQQIIVSPLPALEIKNEDGSVFTDQFCEEDAPVVFQGEADNEDIVTGASFTLDGQPLTVTAGRVTFSPSAAGVGNHILEMIYTSSEDPLCVNSISKTIVVNLLPELSITRLSDGQVLGSSDFDEFCFEESTIVLSGTNNSVAVDGEWRVEFMLPDGTFEELPGSVIVEQPDGSVDFNPNAAAIASGMTRTGNETDMRVYFSFSDANGCFREVFSEFSINPQPQLEIIRDITNSLIGGSSICYDEDQFLIRGRFDGVNNAEDGIFTINTPNTSLGFVNNGNGTASFNPSVIAVDNGQSRTDDDSDYIITFTYTDDNGCTNSIDRTITINGQPEISFTGEFTIDDETSSFTAGASGNTAFETCVVPTSHFIDNSSIEIELRGSNSTGTFTGPGVTNVGNGVARFSPLTARGNDLFSAATSYVIVYTVNETDINGTLCSNAITQEIIVNPIPRAVEDPINNDEFISVNKACFGVDANVSVQIDNVDEANLLYQWFVDDSPVTINGTDSFLNDDLNTENDRSRTYKVRVTNNLTNCSIDYTRSVAFGAIPNPKFKWDFVTAGDATVFTFTDDELESPQNINQFQSLELYIVDSQNDTIFRPDNDFDVQLGETFSYQFEQAGAYEVSMVVNTINGCATSVVRTVDIVPYITVGDDGYTESFETDDHGWYTNSISTRSRFEDGITSSWEVGVPQNTFINSAGTGTRAWVTDLNGDYEDNERTYVYSPTFSIEGVERPTISFQRILDFDTNGDGALLQVSDDGGITWRNLGDVSDDDNDNILEQSGIEWYNSLFIRGFQGDETNPESIGWTVNSESSEAISDDEKWINSIHKLDLSGQNADSVRFRFAIGTNADGVAEGFGFDNFTIFDRSRLSVLETFSTLLSDVSLEANSVTRDKLTDPKLSLSDVIQLNYFNDFQNDLAEGRVDPLNDRNQIVPGTISTFYGINEIPRAVINGVVQSEVPDNINIEDGLDVADSLNLLGWSENELSNSSLSEPLVEIEIEEIIESNNEINLRITVVASSDFPATTELTTRIFIVEGQVNPEDVNGEIGVDITRPVFNVV
ncbi:MAG: hypothetical protein WBA74_26990, partial [Cyclobacteriaceae bacterium]